jgi:hypothetical protein
VKTMAAAALNNTTDLCIMTLSSRGVGRGFQPAVMTLCLEYFNMTVYLWRF